MKKGTKKAAVIGAGVGVGCSVLSFPLVIILAIAALVASLCGGGSGDTLPTMPGGDGNGSTRIVTMAASQIGNVGGAPYWSWYGYETRTDWCGIFVSWCAEQCGYIDDGIIPRFAGCTSQGAPYFQRKGLWQEPGYTPNPGDIIFFDWDQSGDYDHVGIVEKAEGGVIYSIEGNAGDYPGSVMRVAYPFHDPTIVGFGTPNYPTEESSSTTTATETTAVSATTTTRGGT